MLPVEAPAPAAEEEQEQQGGKRRKRAAAAAEPRQASLAQVLQRLQHQAARSPSKAVREAAAAALGVALRAAAAPGAPAGARLHTGRTPRSVPHAAPHAAVASARRPTPRLARSARARPAGAQAAAGVAYASALQDWLAKKKSRLARRALEALAGAKGGAVAGTLRLALAPAPLGALLKAAGGAARNEFKQVRRGYSWRCLALARVRLSFPTNESRALLCWAQVEAVQLLAALVRAGARSPDAALAPPALAALLRPHAGAMGAVLESVAVGGGAGALHAFCRLPTPEPPIAFLVVLRCWGRVPRARVLAAGSRAGGMKAAHHADAAKAAVQLVEALRRLVTAPGGGGGAAHEAAAVAGGGAAGRAAKAGGVAKLAELVGAEHMHGVAKAVVTVRVSSHLSRAHLCSRALASRHGGSITFRLSSKS